MPVPAAKKASRKKLPDPSNKLGGYLLLIKFDNEEALL